MKPGVGERKYELDSICYPIRLAHGYWKSTGDTGPFDSAWKQAMTAVLQTMRIQQRKKGLGPYRFQREAINPTDTLVNGIGNPVKPIGLIASCFRPSDDACIFSFLVPSNLFAVTSLRQLATMAGTILHDPNMANDATALANEVESALRQHAIVSTAAGTIWAYEIDGYGGQVLMDDANVPSLLSLPYLECSPDAGVYSRTRNFVWSESNPWYFRGTAGEGIGGPHIGRDMIWPMSQIIYALTSNSDTEIIRAIQMLKTSYLPERDSSMSPITKITRASSQDRGLRGPTRSLGNSSPEPRSEGPSYCGRDMAVALIFARQDCPSRAL